MVSRCACSADELKELAALRLLIEKSALVESFGIGDVEWEGRVVAAHYKLARMEAELLGSNTSQSGSTSQTQQWKRYDWEFHQALVSACGSRVLMEVHSRIYDRYLRYQMVFGIFRGAVAADEHKFLLACALRRDVVGAQQILEQHVQGCVDFAMEHRLIP